MKITVLFIVAGCLIFSDAEKCIRRTFSDEGFVCVCNSTYCDSVDINLPEKGNFRSWISSKASSRLETEDGVFENNTNNVIKLQLNLTKMYQKILGFGGSFTDSAGFNIKSLSEATQEQLIKAYFSESGSRYTLARVPIGGTDFSMRGYTLDDVPNDETLSNFRLAPEDIDYKMPYMKRALQLSPELRFVSAAWTAPKWMKSNNELLGFFGVLKKEHYRIYANYLIKFLEAYKAQNLPIWAISTGNEPEDAFIPEVPINDMGWTPSKVAKWIVEDFGPALEASRSNETLLLALDDQKFLLPWYIDFMYASEDKVDNYIDGIAFHWYADGVIPSSFLDSTHDKYPNKFLIMTEACEGAFPLQEAVELGSWRRGEKYMHDIIENMNHWVTGWIDWNLALNKTGGPNWQHNEVDSPIIVDPETDEFFKQPMYYALAHFSKFIPPDSVRIDLASNDKIDSAAFLTPESTVVIVLNNPNNDNYSLTIVDPEDGHINVEMEARSFRTIVYRK